jgi:hypothetical protein
MVKLFLIAKEVISMKAYERAKSTNIILYRKE